MKITTLLIMLVLALSQAHGAYPELSGGKYPAEYWQLTMISRGMSNVITREHYSRTQCMEQGIERMFEDMASTPVKEWGVEPTLGFTCEYVTGEDE